MEENMTKRELKIMIMEELLRVLEEKDSSSENSVLDSLISEVWHQKFQEKMKNAEFARQVSKEFNTIYESNDLKYIHAELSKKIPGFAINYNLAKKLMGESLMPKIDDLLMEGEAMEMIKAGGKTLLFTAALAGLAGLGIEQFGTSVGITEPATLGKLASGFIAAAGGLSGLAAIAAGGAKNLINKFKQYAMKAQKQTGATAQTAPETTF
jgi:hypothetical protein